jgi:ABC-type Zn uptake system ZnuABC Zn-binding protein ZnuA
MLKQKPIENGMKLSLVVLAILLLGPLPVEGQKRLNVVTTLPTYAAIAREVVGDLADVESIARGDEDPHFVNPRPSFAAKVQRADLFVATGLDLELWVPAILDRANNSKVDDGGPGNVVAYAGVTLLEVPDSPSRAGGDVHVFGNPHIHTDPINGILIARNIAAGLKRIDPANGPSYDRNLADFEHRVMERLFGEQIIDLLGAETIFPLARNYQLWDFLQSQTYEGRPLNTYLGGWMAQAEPFRDSRIVCYHRNWAYLSARFRIDCAMYVEPKPGIPPSPGHVRAVIDFIAAENIAVLFAANYFSHSQVERVASRANVKALIVPEHVEGAEGIDDYISLVDLWISRLAAAYADRRPGHP